MNDNNYLNEIVNRIRPIDPEKIILFGSNTTGNSSTDSDIDLLVVLKKKGYSSSYREILDNRRMISEKLIDIRKKIPIDLLVYTKTEWEKLVESGSSFFREIENSGLNLL